MNSAKGALTYLKGFFTDINVPLRYDSRPSLESSFQLAKDSRKDSQLFSDYMDSQYAKNYQHFANIIMIAEEEAKSKPKEDVIPSEDAKMEEVKGTEVVRENKAVATAELIEKMSAMKIEEEVKEEVADTDVKINQKILDMLHKTPKEQQIKYSNPIRDYSHLLSNRLVILLI